MAKMSIGIGGRPVLNSTVTDRNGNQTTMQSTSFGDTLNRASAYGAARMPGTTNSGGVSNVAKPVNFGGGYQGGHVQGFGTVGAVGAGRGPVQGARDANGFFTAEALNAGAASRNQGTAPTGAEQVAQMKGVGMAQNAAANGHKGALNIPGVTPAAGAGAGNAVQQQTAAGIASNIANSGIGQRDQQGMVNQSLERLNANRGADKVAAREAALASGFGESAGLMANMKGIDDEYNTKSAAAERDIRLGVARDNASLKNQALGLGLQYSGQQNQLNESAADRAMRQQQMDWERQKYEMAQLKGTVPGNTAGWSGWN